MQCEAGTVDLEPADLRSGAAGDGQVLDGLRVVHVDDALVVVDKPAGLLAVPGRGSHKQDCAWRRVQAWFPDALVVHRLDMATSGLLVLARGASAQRQLSIDFAHHRVGKRYAAVVGGSPPRECGDQANWSEVDLPVAADWPNRPRQRVDPVSGKPARTRWRCIGSGPLARTMRLEVEPLTGRTHQIRLHLAAVGHPILGDTLYAPPELATASARLLLHACDLVLPHPTCGKPLHLVSSAPF